MRINFRQGIITHPRTGLIQNFLAITGVYVTLQTANGQTDVAFAHGQSDYLLTEAADVVNAWGPIPTATDTWLFWDINLQTAVRTFGITLLAPITSPTAPVAPAEGQHWFDTVNTTMYVFEAGAFREVVRVFAAKVNITFTALGSDSPLFSGTQVSIFATVNAGRILVDDTAAPIRRVNGEFFTTESDFFVNGSPVNTIRLEANVLSATALTNMGAFQVVQLTQFGKIEIATYNDLQTTLIAVLMEGLTTNKTGTIITQGTITNPAWNFATPGAELWVDGSGILTEDDPHVTDVLTYPIGKPPIGRVITPTMIFFDQGLGGKGDKGQPGTATASSLATNSVFGIAKLSTAAAVSTNPIVVGDNDPRLVGGPFASLTHQHTADEIVFSAPGFVAVDVQDALTELAVEKLDLTGGTMSGFLTLNGNPSNPLHAATKDYVDNLTLQALTDVTLIVPSIGDVLTYNGFVWTNQAGGGGGGSVIEPLNQIVYGTGSGVDSDADFTYDNATGKFYVNTTDGSTGSVSVALPGAVGIFAASASAVATAGGSITLTAGNGTLAGGQINITSGSGSLGSGGAGGGITVMAGDAEVAASNSGGGIAILAGDGTGSGGGSIGIEAGNDSADGPGGNVTISAGSTASTLSANGGAVSITAGSAGSGSAVGSGGSIDITAGSSFNGNGGSVTITAGYGVDDDGGSIFLITGFAATGAPGIVRITTNGTNRLEITGDGEWNLAGDVGTASEVFTSNGPGIPPTWQPASGGGTDTIYDIGGFMDGVPAASAIVFNSVNVRTLTMLDDFAGSFATAQIAATALTTFSIRRNGVAIGLLTFAAAGTTGTFTTIAIGTDEIFSPGDVLTVVAPGLPDATLADIAITFYGTAAGASLYDISGAIPNTPAGSAIVINHVAVRTIVMFDNFAGSLATAQAAATAMTTFDIQQNGGSIGSLTFAAAAFTGTFTTAGAGIETLFPGDVFTVVAPGLPDATLADIAITFLGTVS